MASTSAGSYPSASTANHFITNRASGWAARLFFASEKYGIRYSEKVRSRRTA